MAKPDYSDLGLQPIQNKHDDLGLQPIPSAQPSSEDPGYLMSGLRGAAQGATFGFEDELAGGLSGALAAPGALFGGKFDDIINAYRQTRDSERAANKSAEEANPKTFLASNIGGSLIPALLTGGASEGATAASLGSDAASAAKAGGLLSRLGGAVKTGAAAGAAAGLGNSDADLTQGDIGGAIGDTVSGGVNGAALGGLLQGGLEGAKVVGAGLKGAAQSIGKTKTARQIGEAFGYGKEGIDLVTEEGLQTASKNLIDKAKEFGLATKQAYKDAGQKIRNAQAQIKESGQTFDISDEISKVEEVLGKLKTSKDPAAAKDIETLGSYLKNLKEGMETTADVQHSTFTPKTIKESPNARQSLEDEATKAEASAKALGQDLKTNIVESEDDKGRKLLTLVKSADEAAEVPGIKVRKSYENSPEGMAKAQEHVAKLNSKAKFEGSDSKFEIVPDDEHGFYNVVERAPGSEDISNADAKSVIQPSAPIEQPQDSQLVTNQVKYRSNPTDLQNASLDDSQDVINTMNRLSGINGGGELQTTPAINAVKQAAGGLKNKITDAGELGLANDQSNSAFQTLKTLGLDPTTSFTKDAITGEPRLTQAAAEKLTNLVRKSETDTSASITSSDRIQEALRLLKGAAPETAEKFAPELSKAANVVDLAQKTQGIKFTKASLAERGPLQIANRVGLGVNSLRNKAPEFWNGVGQAMEKTGGEAGRVGTILKNAATKDDLGRNALLFSLQQQPWAREVLDEWFGKDKNLNK